MSFPWERRLETIRAQERAAEQKKADDTQKADTAAQNQAIARWYGRLMQQASSNNGTGPNVGPSSDGQTYSG